jgi:beta-lactamase superfamily II metal-dependent hydrolase
LAVALLLLWASGRSFGVEGTESDREEPAEPPHFELHILDVSEGHAAIIDFGDKEILIGSGDEDTLYNYISATGIIDGPIELALLPTLTRGVSRD